MTPRQLTLGRQALEDKRMPGCAVVKLTDHDRQSWRDMENDGMAMRNSYALDIRFEVYRLTEAGIAAVREAVA